MQLGFDIDWSGITTNLAKGFVDYKTGTNAIKLQMAQLQAQTAAQRQAMQPPAAYPPAASGVYPAPSVGARTVGTQPYYFTQPAGIPTPVIVAGVGALALLGLALFPRRS